LLPEGCWATPKTAALRTTNAAEKPQRFSSNFLNVSTRRIILGELTDKRKLELNIGFKLRESTRSHEITLSNTKILRESSWYFVDRFFTVSYQLTSEAPSLKVQLYAF